MTPYTLYQRPDLGAQMRRVGKAHGFSLLVAPQSMYIPGIAAQWEEWTGLSFPISGQHTVEGALQPISIDREADLGVYYDPNVWMRHSLGV